MQTATEHETNTAKNQCIEDCIKCNRACLETIAYCLQQGGKYTAAAHIRLLHDCVEICQTSADFMIRGSTFFPQITAVCAAVCRACADACEQVEAGDKMMRECAEICRRSAESCGRRKSRASNHTRTLSS